VIPDPPFTPVTVADRPGWFAPATTPRRAPAVLLVHGAFSHHRHFAEYLGYFARQGFDAWAVSLRGRLGVPPGDARGLRCRDYLEDLTAVVRGLGTRPVLIGHSLGGLLALMLAEEGLCLAAVLLNPAPPGMLTAQPRSLPSFLPLLPAIVRGRPFRPSPRAFARLAFNRLPAAEAARVAGTMVSESGLVFREMMAGRLRIRRERIRCPVLCVGGAGDRVVSRRLVRLTARRAGADHREYPDHGHWIHAEPGWEAVARDVVAWLERRLA
jgi:pimeloyl-ACP methyl ester carboxylesterase